MGMIGQAQSARALGIGDAMVDLSTRVPRLPPRGGNVWGAAVQMHPGGTTANVAANLACLGIGSAFAGRVGDDPYGHYILDVFAAAGVDITYVVLEPGVYTGIVFAAVDDTRERTFFACARGAAHSRLTPEDVDCIDFSEISVMHASGVCLVERPARDGILHALYLARQAGIPVYYDPNLRLEGDVFPEELRKAQWEAMSLADVVLIGEDELALMCGTSSPVEGALRLSKVSANQVVVKRGARGVMAFWAERQQALPAFEVDVVDTTGAGDAFDAGFIAARLRGLGIDDALTYANAVAAIKVTRSGARAVPTHEEVLAFLAARA